jgi:hypothetical protein
VITGVDFGTNSAAEGGGAAVWGSTAVELDACNFTSNSVDPAGVYPYGGGVSIFDLESSTVSNNTFTTNSAGQGGGVSVEQGTGTLVLESNTFTSNSATTLGGGVAWRDVSGDSISNTLTSNTADQGGAVSVSDGDFAAAVSTDVDFNNDVMTNNVATTLAGAVFCSDPTGSVNCDTDTEGDFAGNTPTPNVACDGGCTCDCGGL